MTAEAARRRRGWRGLLVWSALAAVLAGALSLAVDQLTGNIHVVVPGRLVRSATLDADALRGAVARQHIRTIINLRGAHPDQGWWRAERGVAAAMGVRMIDLPWPVRRVLTESEIRQFLALAGSVEEPVLIHCKSGSDRTGLAAALYMAFRLHADEETAEMQLSPIYGHFSLPFLPAWPMDRTFEALEPFLGYFDT